MGSADTFNFGLAKMGLVDIVDLNARFKEKGGIPLAVKIISNITLEFARDLFELPFRQKGFDVSLYFSDTNDLLTAADEIQTDDIVIVFYEFANLTQNFYIKVNSLQDGQVREYTDEFTRQAEYIAGKLKNSKLAIVNRITPVLFQTGGAQDGVRQGLCGLINKTFESTARKNIKLVDVEAILSRLGHKRSTSWRDFYSSQALYSLDFIKEYIETVYPLIMSNVGIRKKLMILDCDNTLWKGILGEEGAAGVSMSINDPVGKIYAEVQSMLVALKNEGIVLAVCSKNNEDDVIDLWRNSNDLILKYDDIAIKRINWKSKRENIKEILSELNIGADAAIFIDDSKFELDSVATELPQILCLQVPDKIYDYPQMVRELCKTMRLDSVSWEDKNKTELYKRNIERDLYKKTYVDHNEYLLSLGMEYTTYIDDKNLSERISQLTQKTNQFNLTTRRYTQEEIINFIESPRYNVFSFGASDKFGAYGIIAVIIIDYDLSGKSGNIDTFLMSCRIIGRKLEYEIIGKVAAHMSSLGCRRLTSSYIPTKKNSQVEKFFDSAGFDVVSKDDNSTLYEIRCTSDSAGTAEKLRGYWRECIQ